MVLFINKGSLFCFNCVGNIEFGIYSVDVFVNGSYSYCCVLCFDLVEGMGVVVCFKVEDVVLFDLWQDLVVQLGQCECVCIDELVFGVQVVFDFLCLWLDVSLLQV